VYIKASLFVVSLTTDYKMSGLYHRLSIIHLHFILQARMTPWRSDKEEGGLIGSREGIMPHFAHFLCSLSNDDGDDDDDDNDDLCSCEFICACS
jgi:hypothetical protein